MSVIAARVDCNVNSALFLSTQTRIPEMCWPVPGVQIVGTAQRDVSRRKKKERWGEKGGENKGTPFPPLSLSLSSFLFFPRSLTSRRAPLSERLEQVTTVPVPQHKVEICSRAQ